MIIRAARYRRPIASVQPTSRCTAGLRTAASTTSDSSCPRCGGEMIWVKCIGIDDKGRVKLSRKAALKERATADGAGVEGQSEAAPQEQQRGDHQRAH